MGCIGGSSSSAKAVSTLNSGQNAISDELSSYLLSKGMGGATPYSGKLIADMPDMFSKAYETLASTMGRDTSILTDALRKQISGAPAYQSDFGETSKRWQESFATPAMSTWKQVMAPLVAEQFNASPGSFYSQDRARGVTKAGSDYFGQYVQPTLFSAYQQDVGLGAASQEAAAARIPGAIGQLQALPAAEFNAYGTAASLMQQMQQAPLSAQYQEFLRTSVEQSPWLKYAIQYMGIPTTEIVAQQGQESPLMGMLAGAGIGGIMGGAGMLGTAGAGSGAALGALAGI